MRTRKTKDVIYPVRIPRDVFERAKEIARELDLSTCQLIRAALRERIILAGEGSVHRTADE